LIANISGTDQAIDKRKRRYELRFFHVLRKQFGKLWSTNKKMTVTFDPWTWYSKGLVRLSRYMFVQNIIKLSAAVHELSC